MLERWGGTFGGTSRLGALRPPSPLLALSLRLDLSLRLALSLCLCQCRYGESGWKEVERVQKGYVRVYEGKARKVCVRGSERVYDGVEKVCERGCM